MEQKTYKMLLLFCMHSTCSRWSRRAPDALACASWLNQNKLAPITRIDAIHYGFGSAVWVPCEYTNALHLQTRKNWTRSEKTLDLKIPIIVLIGNRDLCLSNTAALFVVMHQFEKQFLEYFGKLTLIAQILTQFLSYCVCTIDLLFF